MLRKLKRRIFGLPRHPYPQQFETDMDLPQDTLPNQFVLIASTARSGSHYLGHMLIDQGEYGVPLEYFNHGNYPYWLRRTKRSTPVAALKTILPKRTTPNGIFCFKAHWHQFENGKDEIDAITDRNRLSKVIWIYRRSLIKQAVSLAIAEQTGAWISGAEEQHVPIYKYYSILDAAVRLRDENENWHAFLGKNYPDTTQLVCYEDIANPDSDALQTLSENLNCTPALKPEVKIARQKKNRNSEWIANFLSDMRPDDKWVNKPQHWSL